MSSTTNSTQPDENCGTHAVVPETSASSSSAELTPQTVVELFAATRRSAWALASAADTFSNNIQQLEVLFAGIGRNDASDPLVDGGTMAEPYQYDFDGSCMPGKRTWNGETFSVGVFQWIPKSNGKGLKRSKVIKRFRGMVSNPQPVYDAAENLIAKLENAK